MLWEPLVPRVSYLYPELMQQSRILCCPVPCSLSYTVINGLVNSSLWESVVESVERDPKDASGGTMTRSRKSGRPRDGWRVASKRSRQPTRPGTLENSNERHHSCPVAKSCGGACLRREVPPRRRIRDPRDSPTERASDVASGTRDKARPTSWYCCSGVKQSRIRSHAFQIPL